MRTFCGIILAAVIVATCAANSAPFNVIDFGAKGDGATKDTAAIQRAIDAATVAGGGEVLLPKGIYLCGSVFLKSGVDFHLAEGAVLKGSPDPADYNALDVAPQNWGRLGVGDNISGGHLLLCVEHENVTLRGPGKIDGNVGAFLKMPDGSHPPTKLKIPWRPAQLVWFVESRNIAIRDIEIADAPYWSCFIYGCEDVTVERANIHTIRKPHTYNGDGLDIDSSRRVRVTGCNISTADDSITLRAAGQRHLKSDGPCAHVTVSNCTFSSDCNAIRLGVGNGAIRDCSFRDIRIVNTRYAVNAVGAWSRPEHGVDISNISFENMEIDAKGFCKFYYKFATHSVFEGITFRHVRGKVREPSIFDDTPARPFKNLRFEDVELVGETTPCVRECKVLDFGAKGYGAGSLSTPLRTDGRAEEWLVAGSWGGPAGLSLLGLDYEGEVRPCDGDVVPCRSFDSCTWTNWMARAYTPGVGYVINDVAKNSAWAKGTSYAFSWVVSAEAQTARLAVTHGGMATTLFVNGAKLKPVSSRRLKRGAAKGEGTTDQGNTFEVTFEADGREDTFEVSLVKGVNRVLVKMVRQDNGGYPLVFDAVWKGNPVNPVNPVEKQSLHEITTAFVDPGTDAAKHAALGKMWAKVDVSATANLPHPGDALDVTTAINFPWTPTPRAKKGRPKPVPETLPAVCPFAATIEQVVRDYDGKEVARVAYPITVPGTNTAALCTAGEPGYYSIHTAVKDGEGRVLFAFPSDGFSVIRPVEAKERPLPRKLATCFYWISTNNMDSIFTWMERMDVRHNVGGGIASVATFEEAARRGITLTADFLDTWSSTKEDKKRETAAAVAPYAKQFKAWNEIDICPKARGDGTKWTERTRMEHRIVHEARPDAIYTGGSLVRPASGGWFDACLTNGIYDCVDVWDVHAYPKDQPSFAARHLFNSPDESGQGVEKCIRRTLGRENDKKFIMGETGARCSHGWDARRWQADMVAKMAAWGVASTNYLQFAFLVPWNKGNHGGDIPIAHYPAEAALATASRLLDGYPVEAVEGLPKVVEARRFGRTTMLWARAGTVEVSLPVGKGTKATIVDVIGRERTASVDADGFVHLTATPSPVYIVF